MVSARQTAFEALLKIHKDSAFSNLALDNALDGNPGLDERDRAFVTNVVYGTLDRMMLIDYNLSLYLNQPTRKLKPELFTILRMGAYQILFMDKVPAHAAVSESVKLAKENKSAFAASVVNAVLRRVADNGVRYPENDGDSPQYLSIRYSCPEWLITLWMKAYGKENAVALAEKAMEAPPVTVRVNSLRITADELIWKLAEDGVVSEKVPYDTNTLLLNNTGAVDSLIAYKEGLFHAQDRASQLCCRALDPQKGQVMFDMCASPGGKTFTVAEIMGNEGMIRAFDLYQSRVDLVRTGAERLGIDIIKATLSDSTIFNPLFGEADRILCDVPCSGLGVIRRKPEIRYKNYSDISSLPAIQYEILSNASRYLKRDGRLVYSTCTLNPAENEEVCDRFISEHPEFQAVPFLEDVPRYSPGDRYLTLMPHIHGTDGFFMAVFERK